MVGVERFGDPARTNLDQLAVREALYRDIFDLYKSTCSRVQDGFKSPT
jgi:hypothetical protein